jgi:hypothetical protein
MSIAEHPFELLKALMFPTQKEGIDVMTTAEAVSAARTDLHHHTAPAAGYSTDPVNIHPTNSAPPNFKEITAKEFGMSHDYWRGEVRYFKFATCEHNWIALTGQLVDDVYPELPTRSSGATAATTTSAPNPESSS